MFLIICLLILGICLGGSGFIGKVFGFFLGVVVAGVIVGGILVLILLRVIGII